MIYDRMGTEIRAGCVIYSVFSRRLLSVLWVVPEDELSFQVELLPLEASVIRPELAMEVQQQASSWQPKHCYALEVVR